MIRAHRIAATAQDDASLISGWNIAPNVGYTAVLLPGVASCGVLLYDEGGALVASGAALAGADKPCILVPQSGQSVGMVDADLGWHLLLTTDGTESPRTIRINPPVDLPDEIHPVYAADDMSLARATAAIDDAAHYRDDVTVSCPLGLGAGLGDLVSVPVDGVPVVGQVESITWTGTPAGTSEQVVIRRHVAVAPEAFVNPVPVVPPVVADDAGTTDAAKAISGNVLTNDESGLTVVAVNGLSASVGAAVTGSNGGVFTIASIGAWTFDPDGDFAALEGSETADTSVTYYASDGVGEAMATLTVTVSTSGVVPDDRWADVVFCINASGEDGSTTITDAKGLAISRYGDTQIDTALGYPAVQFDGTGDYLTVPNSALTKIESGVFTFDAWIRFDGIGARRGIIGNRHSSLNNGCVFHTQSNNTLRVFMTGGGLIASSSSFPITAGLHHIELSIDSVRMCRIFIDGVLRGSGTLAAGAASTAALQIGREQDGVSSEMAKDRRPAMRLTRGTTVRHTADFTPPSFPFPTS